MKITHDYTNDVSDHVVEVTAACYKDNFVIAVLFNDGKEQLVDFKPFLSKSLHPSISKYLDETLFTNFKIVDGNLCWNDYDLIFPIDQLHEGIIK